MRRQRHECESVMCSLESEINLNFLNYTSTEVTHIGGTRGLHRYDARQHRLSAGLAHTGKCPASAVVIQRDKSENQQKTHQQSR